MKIILGSSSRWRKQILEQAGFEFTCLAPDIDEKAIRNDDPKELALAIANAKADAVKTRLIASQITEPALLITVDQVVVCNNKIYEKPISKEQAREYMQSYAHYPAQTVTAVVVTNTETGERVDGVDIATVYFHPIPEAQMERLIAEGDIFSCAGGFQIEHDDGKITQYVKHVEGAVDSVKGLPMRLLEKLLTLPKPLPNAQKARAMEGLATQCFKAPLY